MSDLTINIDELYKKWSGESHLDKSGLESYDSSEIQDFGEYCIGEYKRHIEKETVSKDEAPQNIINFKSPYLSGDCDLNKIKVICIPSKPRYEDVDICFKDGMNIAFADVGRRKELSFEDRIKIGEEIEKRWNAYENIEENESIEKLRESLEFCVRELSDIAKSPTSAPLSKGLSSSLEMARFTLKNYGKQED